jgi:hypothetical protein
VKDNFICDGTTAAGGEGEREGEREVVFVLVLE